MISNAGITAIVTCTESDLKRVVDVTEELKISVVSIENIQKVYALSKEYVVDK